MNKVFGVLKMLGIIDNKFETIDKDTYCKHDSHRDYVIKDNVNWQNLWAKVHGSKIPQPKTPIIYFKKDMVLGVFLGVRSSGGYGIEISRIHERDNCLEVYVEESTPAPGTMQTQALTQPYHLVKTALTDKKIKYIR